MSPESNSTGQSTEIVRKYFFVPSPGVFATPHLYSSRVSDALRLFSDGSINNRTTASLHPINALDNCISLLYTYNNTSRSPARCARRYLFIATLDKTAYKNK